MNNQVNVLEIFRRDIEFAVDRNFGTIAIVFRMVVIICFAQPYATQIQLVIGKTEKNMKAD